MGCGSSTVKNNKVKDFETDVEKKERLRNISFYRSGLVHLEAVSTHKNLFSAIKRGDLEGVKKLVDDEDVDQALGKPSNTTNRLLLRYSIIYI